ncbi:MAG: FkbM family methyltransferase [Candidatus Acidiferrales bacterium]
MYDLYWSIADRRILESRDREVKFYRQLLEGFRPGGLIFDIGANAGYKSDIFLRLGASVVAVEPDDASQGVLRRRFLRLRLRKKRLIVEAKAASEQSSIQRMWIDAPGSAMNTLSQKWAQTLREDDQRFGHRLNFGKWKEVKTVSVEELMVDYGSPFFVKIDVEGHEISVLRGLRRTVPYLSFEVNLPEFRREGLECIRTLAALSHDGQFNFTPDCGRGLVLEDWVPAERMSAELESCTDNSIEIFWRTAGQKSAADDRSAHRMT